MKTACAPCMLGTPPNLVIVYTALKPRHRQTLTIVIESVGKIKIDKDKEALFNGAYNVTDNISSRAVLRQFNIFNRYLPDLLYLPSTTPLYASVSKGAASTTTSHSESGSSIERLFLV